MDVAGTALTDEERDRAASTPWSVGVILFARNYTGSDQLRRAHRRDPRALRDPALIIAVDHEGGRVQRFRSDGFTAPAADAQPVGRCGNRTISPRSMPPAPPASCSLRSCWRTASTSVSPLRLTSTTAADRAIGNRAFHRDPQAVAVLAQALAAGMAEAGMGCVGKHFPGHGFVEADSHHDVPVDDRDFDTLWAEDIAPYRHRLGRQLAGVMPAHVIYPKADPSPQPQPAGFSPFWLKDVLRGRLGFKGLIFSDDLNMEGARVAGDIVGRARAAFEAGCDMLLVCNRPDLAAELLDRWASVPDADNVARLAAIVPNAPRPAWLADPSRLNCTPPTCRLASTSRRFPKTRVPRQP
ncbi:MAG: beta-N-acetylhexosaminidase [Comamonadaceae bacterium]|nr:beta-N-acetylhexosaminidase [Comamonadaceae bacterium]